MPKILTFSYDDGVTQDIRLIELLNRYGMKATFNLNSDLLGLPAQLRCHGKAIDHTKVKPYDVRSIYQGHEVAGHTKTHPLLPAFSDDTAIIREVEEDRLKLSELCGYEVVGFAYPCGGKNYDHRISKLLRQHTGVRYARTIESCGSFKRQDALYEFHPTAFHLNPTLDGVDSLTALGEKFLSLDTDETHIFYIWGHSYEFDIHNSWKSFEEFLKLMANRPDIRYLTNKEALLQGV